MGASIWYPGYNVTATVRRQDFIGTQGQTIFDLTDFMYTPGSGNLQVYINGQLQRLTADYTETNSTRVTLVEGVIVGDLVSLISVGA